MSKRSLISALAACLLNLVVANIVAAGTPLAVDEQREYVTELIAHYFPKEQRAMLAVARCESGLIHRSHDGDLLPNQAGSSARGVLQILMRIHGPEMKRLGLDPENDKDYMAYVRRLYDQYGLAPWNESRSCWRRYASS